MREIQHPENAANMMQRGRVKWFNENKGYGYIVSERGEDVFVHFSVIEMEGYRTLQAGAPVRYEFISGEKGLLATRVIRETRASGNSRAN